MSRILYSNEYLVTFVNTIIKDITIHTLTEQNNVNRNRLSYVFRKHAGMGAAEYLLNYRIKMAQKMLCTSDVPVQQIAQAVGIADPFILVEFSRSELAFRLLNIAKFINNPY